MIFFHNSAGCDIFYLLCNWSAVANWQVVVGMNWIRQMKAADILFARHFTEQKSEQREGKYGVFEKRIFFIHHVDYPT